MHKPHLVVFWQIPASCTDLGRLSEWSGSFWICQLIQTHAVLLRQTHVFCWGKTNGRTCDIWREHKYDSTWQPAWIANYIGHASSSLLIFTSLREAWQRTSWISTGSGHSHWLGQIQRGLAGFDGSCFQYWLIVWWHCLNCTVSILTLLNRTTGLTTEIGIAPQKLLQKRSTSPCHICHPFAPNVGSFCILLYLMDGEPERGVEAFENPY